MINYAKLKQLLNSYFSNNWVISVVPKGSNLKDNYAILNYVSGDPEVCDDEISYINDMYQLAYYTSDIEKDIDDFFINNKIIFENKRCVFLDDFNIYQYTYDFYVYK